MKKMVNWNEKLWDWMQKLRDGGHVAKGFATDPKQLVHLLEEQSPWLAKKLLSLASGVVEPHLLGRGLKIEEWTGERVGLKLPHRPLRKMTSAELSVTSLVGMGEFAMRLYWDRYIDLVHCQLEIKKTELELTHPVRRGVCARLELTHSVREQLLFEMNRLGGVDCELQVLLLSEKGQKLGHIHFSLALRGLKGLPPAGPSLSR